jgi:hypothetical protein
MPAPMFSSVAPIPRSTAPNGARAVGLAMVLADFTKDFSQLSASWERGRGEDEERGKSEKTEAARPALGRAAAVPPAARSCAGLLCLPGAWGAAGEAVPLPRFNAWGGVGCAKRKGLSWRPSARPLSTPSRFGPRAPRVPVHAGAAVRIFLARARRPLPAGAGEVDEASVRGLFMCVGGDRAEGWRVVRTFLRLVAASARAVSCCAQNGRLGTDAASFAHKQGLSSKKDDWRSLEKQLGKASGFVRASCPYFRHARCGCLSWLLVMSS